MYHIVYHKASENGEKRISGLCAFVLWLLVEVTAAAGEEDIKLSASTNESDPPACLSASGETAVIACRRELNLAPNDLAIRFALCDALIHLRRHKEAVDVLKEGLERLPGSNRIKKKLALAESYLEEQVWIEKRRAQQTVPPSDASDAKLDTVTKLNIIRCTKLKGDTALKACNTALKVLPNDPSLYRGKADALLSMNRLGEAVLAYRESLRFDPANPETTNSLLAAESQREVTVTRCQQLEGIAALDACDTALIKGSADEFAIQSRKGDLLLGMNRTAEALEAYNTARKLNPSNAEITQKIAALTKPVRVAKKDEPTRQKRISKPQAQVTPEKPTQPRQPITLPSEPQPEEPIQETEVPAQIATVKQAANIDSSPTRTYTPPPAVPQPKRYSNKPATAGITH